jgi:parallel beta-helix repeat protein
MANSWDGISLRYSSSNSISGNNITNNREGVLLVSSSNNTISENIIKASTLDFGIMFRGSSNNTVSENIITHNMLGIALEWKSKIPNSPIVYSSDNVIYHNSFVNNPYQALGGLRNVWDDGYPSGGNYWSDYKGTDADHDGVGDTPYVIDANNTDYYPLMNLYVQSGAVYIRADGSIDPSDAPISTVDKVTYTFTGNIASDAGIVIERDSILVDGQGYTVQGTWRGTGITLSGRSNVTIKNTEITAFIFGIWLGYSSNNSISGNGVAANSWVGIKLQNCLDINIVNNDITDNDLAGIWLFFSNSSLVSQNRIARTHIAGIILDISSNNTIFENDVRDNNANMVFEYSVNGGVALSSRNRILHNNFINSTWKAITHFSGQPENFWDDGYPSGGNYWSDYNGTDADHDGIGDTEYTIDASNIDHYPLTGMFHSYNVTYYTPPIVPYACSVTVISNSTISDFVAPIWIEHPEVIFLQFNVSGAEGSNGFCRVSFPTAMMNGTYHVSLNGTEIPYTLLPCSNANTSYLYFNYTHPKQRVMIIPEFPSFLILPLFFMATLLAVITYRRKHH